MIIHIINAGFFISWVLDLFWISYNNFNNCNRLSDEEISENNEAPIFCSRPLLVYYGQIFALIISAIAVLIVKYFFIGLSKLINRYIKKNQVDEVVHNA